MYGIVCYAENLFGSVPCANRYILAIPMYGIECYAENLFGSVPCANRYILASSENFVELLIELFWSVQVVLKNTDEKP